VVRWARDAFRHLKVVFSRGDKVPLAEINEETALGKELLAEARRLLAETSMMSPSMEELASPTRRWVTSVMNPLGTPALKAARMALA